MRKTQAPDKLLQCNKRDIINVNRRTEQRQAGETYSRVECLLCCVRCRESEQYLERSSLGGTRGGTGGGGARGRAEGGE